MMHNAPTPPQDSTTWRVAVCVAVTAVLVLLIVVHFVMLSRSYNAATLS